MKCRLIKEKSVLDLDDVGVNVCYFLLFQYLLYLVRLTDLNPGGFVGMTAEHSHLRVTHLS